MGEPWRSGGIIGPYRLDRLIGQGGLGQVWLAQDSRLKRPVAVKVMNNKDGGAAPGRLSREARALANLNHPSVVQIYDAGTEGDYNYIVTEFVDGVDLATLISQGCVRINWALQISMQIVEAVMALHGLGIIHRDIKPSNIMVDSRHDRAKLTDFGLAKGSSSLKTVTTAGAIVGTPVYMSPEQLAGEECGPATDVFSLGATLYHLFTGKPPRDVTNLYSLAKEASTQHPQPPGSIRPEIPEPLSAAIMSMLEPKPRNRLSSIDDLQRILGEAAGSMSPPKGQTLWERALEPLGGKPGEDDVTVIGEQPAPQSSRGILRSVNAPRFIRSVFGIAEDTESPEFAAVRRIKFWLIGRMLKEGLDLYLPPAGGGAVDAVMRRADGSFVALRVEARAKEAPEGEAASFTVIPPEPEYCWFIFYAGRMDMMWIMKSEEFMTESVQNKMGRNKGKRSIRLGGTRVDEATGRKAEYCEEHFGRYMAGNFHRLRNE